MTGQPDLRAITVKQPWAEAIWEAADDPAAKTVENRGGGFARNYRGLLAIHAGMGWSRRGEESPLVCDLLDGYPDVVIDDGRQFGGVRRIVGPERVAGHLCHRHFAFGVIGAVGDLADVHEAHPGCCDSPWAEHTYVEAGGKLRTRVTHLVLEDVRRVGPVSVRGALGLWRPSAEVVADVLDDFGLEPL